MTVFRLNHYIPLSSFEDSPNGSNYVHYHLYLYMVIDEMTVGFIFVIFFLCNNLGLRMEIFFVYKQTETNKTNDVFIDDGDVLHQYHSVYRITKV